MLGVSRPRVHQLVRAGELEARRMAGRLFVGSRSLERVQRGRRSRGRPPIRKPLTLHELRQQRDQIVAIGRRHGAGDIRVFGSVARGDARPDSDVDFLVTLDPGRTVLDLSELIIDLEEALRRPIDVVEIRRPSRSESDGTCAISATASVESSDTPQRRLRIFSRIRSRRMPSAGVCRRSPTRRGATCPTS